MKCKTCGQSLHPEQKICINCGTQTDRWPGGPTVQQKPAVEVPWKTVGMVGGGVLLLLIIVLVALSLRITPPDQVAKLWTDAVLTMNFDKARTFTTERFESSQADRSASAEKGDQYYMFVNDNKGDYTVGPPQMSGDSAARVTLTFTGANGQTLKNEIELVKQGKAWKINRVAQ
jgi:uncharacterized membrane protein YvbJ